MSEKRCTRCGEIKPLDDFRKDSQTRDGHRAYCKECVSRAEQEYRNRPDIRQKRAEHRQANYGKRRYDYGDRYKGKYKETAVIAIERWHRNNPGAAQAHSAVYRAVRDGRLPHASDLACNQCGNQALDYHHHNGYSREHWLDVIPLCRSCHRNVNCQ